jgi:hypothetical protein
MVAADDASGCGEMSGPIDGSGIDVSGVVRESNAEPFAFQ